MLLSTWIGIGSGLVFLGCCIVTAIRLSHKHNFVEHVGGIWAEEEGGPRTCHEIWWECVCGDVIDLTAKKRSEWAERKHVQAIIPRKVIYGN